MRLQKIRLAGFKSFVDPTNIPFPGDMTAIVGPNGCGKSNIIDAVRWVLGESSAKNLRGDAMIDVIFNGSSSRKAVSQCSVELVFDNTSKRIGGEFAAYSEISVKRVVTKEAVSSYFLNSAKCRRRDITDLFLGTGLGPRSYAIIEQGMISKLVESKPQELRVFIEEAAGISKYKERRKETLTRIKHTKENLDRLEDVRQELGEQLAKLKRQALAANRYKELKQQERQLKAELATLKWLAQRRIMDDAQANIMQEQQLLAKLEASQQSNYSSLQALKNQQTMTKSSIDNLQKEIFTVGTEVTKLEQLQLFAKKRRAQIQSEIEQITQTGVSLNMALQSLLAEITDAQEKRAITEPEKEIIQEQLFELEDKKVGADARLEKQLRVATQTQDAFYSKAQLLDKKNSQIQYTLSLQTRTQTRVDELIDELSNLANKQSNKELAQLSDTRHKLTELVIKQEKRHCELSDQLHQARAKQNEAQHAYEHQRDNTASVKAKLDALEALQMSSLGNTRSSTSASRANVEPVLDKFTKETAWEFFHVENGSEKILNSVLQEVGAVWVIDAALSDPITHNWPLAVWLHAPQSLLFKQSFTQHKVKGTLASLLINELVPQLFNHYFLAMDHTHALELLRVITANDRIIVPNGDIYTIDTFIKRHQGDNKIARAAQIKILHEQHTLSQSISMQARILAEQTLESVNQIQQAQDTCHKQLSLDKQRTQALEINYQNMLFQQQQSVLQSQKIQLEMQQNKQRLAQENMAVEILNDEVNDLVEVLVGLEEIKNEALQTTESLRVQQLQWHAQHTQMQSSLHQHSMLLQQICNSVQILQEQQANRQLQFNENEEKLSRLHLETHDLSVPQDVQHENLQSLLTTQQQQQEAQVLQRNSLVQLELDMAEIEKGQIDEVVRINEIKARIETKRIALESAKVRAQSFIEQLQQLHQSLKDIVATLPVDADEQTWQSELNSTSDSVARLGAVNLAAVDEFQQQSKRKDNLDAQNLDLTQALDMLENAMRKIDKETTLRFKSTFDAVNNDLKSLFPKVFGGGMAYLALNDDDMLDTGVTIMARPPGKKNSTIGLLSGGEKALTALSLVFAIFRLNPAPFCLLDEVDAPLDDANVGRFCRLVSQMSESVQFIYITHNKVAMEMATHLTGVTMAEPGVSRMVAVDMEQALVIAE